MNGMNKNEMNAQLRPIIGARGDECTATNWWSNLHVDMIVPHPSVTSMEKERCTRMFCERNERSKSTKTSQVRWRSHLLHTCTNSASLEYVYYTSHTEGVCTTWSVGRAMSVCLKQPAQNKLRGFSATFHFSRNTCTDMNHMTFSIDLNHFAEYLIILNKI